MPPKAVSGWALKIGIKSSPLYSARIGLSLEMNSANRLIKNRARNIHNDQKPRRLPLKVSQRRRCRAESQGGRRGSPWAVTSSMIVVSVGASMRSHLARLEIDARIHPGIGEIGDEADDEAEQREDVDRGEPPRIVAVHHGFEAEQAKPIQREDRLDQEGAGKEGPDEGAGKAGDDDQHGVAEHMAVEHLVLGEALGPGRHHILLPVL